jgi:hypothetical protein
MRQIFLAVAAVCSVVGFVACSDADEAIDCHKICEEYRDCYNDDYDVDACEDRCDNVSNDNNDRADECERCFDDTSCTEQAFSCQNECAGIIN